MIDGLITGKMHARAELRTGKNGNEYVVAKVRVPVANGEAVFANCVVFEAEAARVILALAAGDPIALTGAVTPGAWIDREGNPRPSLNVVVHQALTLYGMDKKRKASRPADAAASASRGQGAMPPDDLDDGSPLDW